MADLYIIELTGDSRARGIQHGSQLREPIQKAVDFYRAFFAEHVGLDAADMRRKASRFMEPTARAFPELMAEYEGIAEGSGQTLEDILALSARYEITYESIALGECSNIFVGPQRSSDGHVLLAQSWDWRPEVMDFRAVFTARCDDLPDHIMVTECGQPGKYGVNEHGVGVVSAGLSCQSNASVGDQMFVTLGRMVLAQKNAVDAREAIRQNPPQVTCNMLAADAGGQGVYYEATPSGLVSRDLGPNDIYWHTNHCRIADEPSSFANSVIRGRRWDKLLAGADNVGHESLQGWLANRSDGDNSICMLPVPAKSQAASWLQTLCSIVMDLNAKTLWVSNGPSCRNPYQQFHL